MQVHETSKGEDAVNRVHLDLRAEDVEAEVDRLLELGATRVQNWPYPAEASFVVLRDPSGNELCVTEPVDG